MNRMQEQVQEFHERFGILVQDSPNIPDEKIRQLRYRLIKEEFAEFMLSSEDGDIENTIKELADLAYVVFGTAISYGIDLQRYFDEVQRSNMSKIWPDGTIHYDAGGKVMKPPTYSKADISKVLHTKPKTIQEIVEDRMKEPVVLDLSDMSEEKAAEWLSEFNKLMEHPMKLEIRYEHERLTDISSISGDV